MKYLRLDHILRIHERMIEKFGGTPGIRDMGLIESAVAQPQAAFGGQEAYPSLPEKAAALGFSLVKNHGFVDGNKRVAAGAVEMMLLRNGFEIAARVDEAEGIYLDVAAGQLSREKFSLWIENRMVPKRMRMPVAVLPTSAEGLHEKAYTARVGETFEDWFRRGCRESGEARENFRATLMRYMRVSIRTLAFGEHASALLDEEAARERSRIAFDEVLAWVNQIARSAGLSDWEAESLPEGARDAFSYSEEGPAVRALTLYKMGSILGLSIEEMVEAMAEAAKEIAAGNIPAGRRIGDASAEASRWARDRIREAKIAPDNPHGDDDESIAAAILAGLRAEPPGPDEPFAS